MLVVVTILRVNKEKKRNKDKSKETLFEINIGGTNILKRRSQETKSGIIKQSQKIPNELI